MIMIIVGYDWCLHYKHVISVLKDYPQYLMSVQERGAVGEKNLLLKIKAATVGKTPLGKPVGSSSPQVFVRYHDIVYCLGGDDDVTHNIELIKRYFI
jgi:hypothetical protein